MNFAKVIVWQQRWIVSFEDNSIFALGRQPVPGAKKAPLPAGWLEYFQKFPTATEHLPAHLAPQGTDFQQRVWRELLRIPLGETRTYGEIAAALGAPRAARAVGSACKSNPIPFLIPCHRVVPATGGVGHYLFGSKLKDRLLQEEKSCKQSNTG